LTFLVGTQRAVGAGALGGVAGGALVGKAAFGVFGWLEVLDFDLFFGFLPFLHA